MKINKYFNLILNELSDKECQEYINYQKDYISYLNDKSEKTSKYVKEKNWECLHDGCDSHTNSYGHLLQKRGILNRIATSKNTLYQLATRSMYIWGSFNNIIRNDKIPPMQIKEIGIKTAFADKIFCDLHDTGLFKVIENVQIPNFKDYISQILLCYRAICYEIRQDEQVSIGAERSIEATKQYMEYLTNSCGHHINVRICELLKIQNVQDMNNSKISNYGALNRIDGLSEIKALLYSELDKQQNTFKFIYIETDKLEIATSTIFSSELTKHSGNNYPVFIHIIPQENSSLIIIGISEILKDDWMVEYIKKWEGFSAIEIKLELSRLLLTEITTWCMSESFYLKVKDTVENSWQEVLNRMVLENQYGFTKESYIKQFGNVNLWE